LLIISEENFFPSSKIYHMSVDLQDDGRLLIDSGKRGNVNLMREIINSNHRVNPNPQDGLGNTPLIYSAMGGHVDTATILLKELKGDPNVQNYAGDTALHKACHEDNRVLITLLVTSGANPNIANKKGIKPIDLAKTREVSQILKSAKHVALIDDDDIVVDDDDVDDDN